MVTKRYRVKIRNIAMGVPINFLSKYNPDQFEIETNSTMSGVSANFWTYINGSPKYARIFIRKKPKKTKRYRVKVHNIVMGVPITFLDKYNPKQFEIVGASMDSENTFCHIQKDYVKLGYKFFKQDGGVSGSGALKDKMSPKIPVKGKSDYSLAPDGSVLSAVYGRVFIRKKPKNTKQYHIKVRNIVMGVPITFLDKYCPKQFEIEQCCEPAINLETLRNLDNFKEYKSRQIVINDVLCQKTYHRFLIRRKLKQA